MATRVTRSQTGAAYEGLSCSRLPAAHHASPLSTYICVLALFLGPEGRTQHIHKALRHTAVDKVLVVGSGEGWLGSM